MRKTEPKNPKARNNSAHASLQSYFDRIANSLEDRLREYVQMRKYIRVHEESKKLLEIEKAINVAAGSIFEINIESKLDVNALKQLVQSLVQKNKALKSFIKGKPQTLQIKLLHQAAKNIHLIIGTMSRLNKHINRINEVIPIIHALLKLPEKESNYENDPILVELGNALSVSANEPNLIEVKTALEKAKIPLYKNGIRLNFEEMNDVSDKLVGLLNDKLLLIISVSELIIAGTEDDGANDIPAHQRLHDELMVLFLVSSLLDVIYRIKELRNGIKLIFNSIKLCLKITNSDKLENHQHQALLKSGNNSVYELLSNTTPKVLQRIKKAVIEMTPGLDAFDLKLKIDTLDLETVIKMTYGLIYEKANRIWENPYDV